MVGEHAPSEFDGQPSRTRLTVQTLLPSPNCQTGQQAVDFYFIEDNGSSFKATIPYEPYFYLTVRVSLPILLLRIMTDSQAGTETIVEEWAVKKFEGVLNRVEREKKWDLSLVSSVPFLLRSTADLQPNHLLSAPPIFLKLFFHNTADLQSVRRELLPLAKANSAKFTAVDAYADIIGAEAARNGHGDEEMEGQAWGAEADGRKRRDKEPAECIIDVREYDIAYYLRVAIDLGEFDPAQSSEPADM